MTSESDPAHEFMVKLNDPTEAAIEFLQRAAIAEGDPEGRGASDNEYRFIRAYLTAVNMWALLRRNLFERLFAGSQRNIAAEIRDALLSNRQFNFVVTDQRSSRRRLEVRRSPGADLQSRAHGLDTLKCSLQFDGRRFEDTLPFKQSGSNAAGPAEGIIDWLLRTFEQDESSSANRGPAPRPALKSKVEGQIDLIVVDELDQVSFGSEDPDVWAALANPWDTLELSRLRELRAAQFSADPDALVVLHGLLRSEDFRAGEWGRLIEDPGRMFKLSRFMGWHSDFDEKQSVVCCAQTTSFQQRSIARFPQLLANAAIYFRRDRCDDQYLVIDLGGFAAFGATDAELTLRPAQSVLKTDVLSQRWQSKDTCDAMIAPSFKLQRSKLQGDGFNRIKGSLAVIVECEVGFADASKIRTVFQLDLLPLR
jgi:hypothetical protein